MHDQSLLQVGGKQLLNLFLKPFSYNRKLNDSYLFSLGICFLKTELPQMEKIVFNDGVYSLGQSVFRKIYAQLLVRQSQVSSFFSKMKEEFHQRIRDLYIGLQNSFEATQKL